ncbi:MAG: hypothetical protein IJI45_09265 [Anaerolineaceae bacterium]|nr:hypothetical protein [Anaerolineaceae bacterium]
MTEKRNRLFKPDRLIWLLLLLLLLERLLLFIQLGPDYLSYSDDEAYVKAGLYFAETGVISMWGPFPSAMIMPAMPVLIGLLSFLFGSGTALLVAVKTLWILMGVLTAYVIYRTVTIFCYGWAGLFAAAHFLIPNLAWMNHVLLTETPYMFFLSLAVYETLCLGENFERKHAIRYLIAVMTGLMFRTNMLFLPLLTGFYLLFRRVSFRILLKFAAAICCSLLLFVIPWSIRNHVQFGAFIPITYGGGNPFLLGTYQGEGYPADEELDYKANVYDVMHNRYASYYREEKQPWTANQDTAYYIEHYDPDGEVKELKHAQFLSLQADGIKAKYRIREWQQRDLAGFLKSYLLIKPRWMLNWSWAWEEAFHVPYQTLHRLSQVNAVFCALTVLLSLLRKQYRSPILFLSMAYLISVYLYATAFVSDRYASTLMLFRYLLVGFGFSLVCTRVFCSKAGSIQIDKKQRAE